MILFHLPRAVKESLAAKARKEGKSTTRLLNELIAAYITPKKKVGRGNVDLAQVEGAKQILRTCHPDPVSATEIAKHVGCTRARAERLLDILSGNAADSANAATGFLVYEDDTTGSPMFGIAKDIEMTGNAPIAGRVNKPGGGAYKHMWNQGDENGQN